MKLIIGISFLLLFSLQMLGQNQNNNVEIITNNSLTYWITSPSNLESDQVIQNAIIIRVRAKTANCTIYARLSNTTFPSGFVMPPDFMKLDWTYDNSNKEYNLITTPISLDNTDKFFFNQRKMPAGSTYYDYYYDMIITPPYYSMIPGSYSFTILFTMTQP